MRLAFYAPMKPPSHPVPSGDREMARALMAALAGAGAEAVLASGLRIYDGAGDPAAQAALAARAEAEAARIIARHEGDGLSAWITYHNYYKAPDLIGPAVSAALNLPYVQIESTRARKRLAGPWAGFARAAEAATDAAAAVLYLTDTDRTALERDRPEGQVLAHLRPFLPRTDLPAAAALAPGAPVLIAGMMRPGDKLASYRIAAETLSLLPAPPPVEIAGDGPARSEVEALMAGLGGAVRFLGRLDGAGMAAAYARAGALLWPGVNEAFGMVYLEAQAAGLPVVAQDRPGPRAVLAPGDYPAPEAGAAALAARLAALLRDAGERHRRGAAARTHVAEHHLIGGASATLSHVLGRVVRT